MVIKFGARKDMGDEEFLNKFKEFMEHPRSKVYLDSHNLATKSWHVSRKILGVKARIFKYKTSKARTEAEYCSFVLIENKLWNLVTIILEMVALMDVNFYGEEVRYDIYLSIHQINESVCEIEKIICLI